MVPRRPAGDVCFAPGPHPNPEQEGPGGRDEVYHTGGYARPRPEAPRPRDRRADGRPARAAGRTLEAAAPRGQAGGPRRRVGRAVMSALHPEICVRLVGEDGSPCCREAARRLSAPRKNSLAHKRQHLDRGRRRPPLEPRPAAFRGPWSAKSLTDTCVAWSLHLYDVPSTGDVSSSFNCAKRARFATRWSGESSNNSSSSWFPTCSSSIAAMRSR
jgi:hypothetical protein